MSLEVIEKVTQVETETRERKSAAEAEAKKIIADAEREGLALLQQVRAKAAEDERYAGLADIVEANRGLWCPEAERYLLEHWKQQ